MLKMPRHQRGFTLIELIVTITIMGILAYGSVQFILNTSGAYASSQERSRLGLLATSTVERLTQEIKNAPVHSLKVYQDKTAECLQLQPNQSYVAVAEVEKKPVEGSAIKDQQVVTFCHVEGYLYRYANTINTPLPSNTTQGRLMLADHVSSPTRPFEIIENGLGQPQWVLLTLDFTSANSHLLIQQEIGLSPWSLSDG